jgi:hypothetical protein
VGGIRKITVKFFVGEIWPVGSSIIEQILEKNVYRCQTKRLQNFKAQSAFFLSGKLQVWSSFSARLSRGIINRSFAMNVFHHDLKTIKTLPQHIVSFYKISLFFTIPSEAAKKC